MTLNHYITKNYKNKPSLLTMEKQTQTKPIYKGRLALIQDAFLRMIISVNCYIVFAQVAAIAKIAVFSYP
jgi:hypothetical protein